MDMDRKTQPKNSDLPPFVKSWKQFYALLVLWLLVLIILFYLFSISFE
ncbi:MAG: hypothetical protein JWQ28_1073 [Pedobacter sp.]|jgi:hypothetical protein|nr:hypothetical protein [Pedobacter sp.]